MTFLEISNKEEWLENENTTQEDLENILKHFSCDFRWVLTLGLLLQWMRWLNPQSRGGEC